MQLSLSGIAYSYADSPITIFDSIDATFPHGWTGVVGANGAGKTTLLRIATGELVPDAGVVTLPGEALYCAQGTDVAPPLLDEFALEWTAEAALLRSRLRIGDDWPWRFETLSHGERKRLQLAVALWRRPAVLAVDEPTNHLDATARELIRDALAGYDGIGLLVSHDRDLLDELVERCLVLGSDGAVMRPGTYTQAHEQAERETHAAVRARDAMRAEERRLHAEAVRRRAEADSAQAKRSRRHLDPKDSDGRARIGLAIFTGKDGKAGRLSAQLERRTGRVEEQLRSMRVETSHTAPIWLPQAYSRAATVASLPPQRLAISPDRSLELPTLTVGPRDRIAITGPNGSGKSTLVRALVAAATVVPERVVYLAQELTVQDARAVVDRVRALGDAELGRLMSIVSRLGSRPARILDGEAPSPGELRKLLIALGVMREPHLIVLDEPTNHLDLPATEALENALAECPCALVLVSHGARFLGRLTDVRWELEDRWAGTMRLEVR